MVEVLQILIKTVAGPIWWRIRS